MMRADRALWVTLGVLALAIAAFALRQNGPSASAWMPPCQFHRFTGLNCPGCGMTRAAHAALNGDFAKAIRFNPVGMILLPLASLGLLLELTGWVRGKPLPFRLYLGAKAGWGFFTIIFCFWILRNIPVWPFTLLSPPQN